MKGREIATIVRNQLRSVETGDQYSDDYYFLLLEERRRLNPGMQLLERDKFTNEERPAEMLRLFKQLRAKSSAGEDNAGTSIIVERPSGPLPELPGHRPAQLEAMERRSKINASATNHWAGKKEVLGRLTRSNIRTPRELIALRESIVQGGNVENKSGEDNKKEFFAAGGWKLRRIVSSVCDTMGEISDVNRLLKAKASALPRGPLGPEWDTVRDAMKNLEDAQRASLEKLAAQMGLAGIEDDATLLSLLWLPRGRRAACRATKSLLPEHLLAFLEASFRMLVFFVCTSPDGSNSSDSAEREKAELDDVMAFTLSNCMNESFDLAMCTKSLRLFLASQTPESLRAVVATPGGALVMKGLLLHGQESSDKPGSAAPDSMDWTDAFNAFLAMAEEGISAKEGKR